MLKTTEDEMTGPWILGQVQGDEAPTQILGRVVHAVRKIEAILFRPARTDLAGAAWPSCPTG
jgi:hypothetical protein